MAPKFGVKKVTGPKRTRISHEEESITPTFFNDTAAREHALSIVYRTCIQERGFTLTRGSIFQMIVHRGWERLTAQPSAALVPIIREFYANAREQHKANPSELVALVRGKMVSYSRHAINELYGLESIDEDDYGAWLARGPDMEAVLGLLSKPGTKWKGKANSFPRAQLTPESRAWHYFISAKLLPSNHVSDVTKDRALLNYAIQTGLTIDIGRVIERSIVSFFSGKMTGGLRHPSLIYGLCLKAGVPTSSSEEIQHPLSAISNSMMDRFEKKEMWEELASDPTEEQPDPSQQPGTSSQPLTMEQRLTALEGEIHNMRETQERWNQERLYEQRQQFQYFVDFNTSLTNMFQNCSLFQGSSTVVFPTPPVFQPVPPPAEEQESDPDE